MQFHRVIGKIDPKLVEKAEEKLSQVFLELATRYNNEHVGSQLGGDPAVFALMYPSQHICTLNIPTCATNGLKFFYNPNFVLKLSRIGLRLVCSHEAWHALYLHPQRRGSRLPKLFNIAVDYIVNGMVMEDLTARKKDAKELFTKHLGRYMTLEQYAELLKNPFAPPKGFEDLDPSVDAKAPTPLPEVDEDRELTAKEIAEIERREKAAKFFYADPDLPEDMKSPEKIYDYLYNLLPKCQKCGRVGVYQKPQKDDKKGKGKGKGEKSDQGDSGKDKGKGKGKKDKQQAQDQGQGGQQDQSHDHGDGEPCDCPDHNQGQGQGDQSQGQGGGQCDHESCPDCSGGVDIFDLGGLVDDHMDAEESQEKLAKRISDAMETARKMAGHVPGALEDELGKLTAPKVRWQDVIRSRVLKARAGNGRNDWTRFRNRPMFAGLMVPKRRSFVCNFGVLLDTSGSMSKEDMAYGISQLQSLDDRGEAVIVPCDATPYWNLATKVKKCNAEELTKVKVAGRGGTMFSEFFKEYEKNIGKQDFLVILTDGYLNDMDVAEANRPDCDVFWVITSGANFVAPFGRVMDLKD